MKQSGKERRLKPRFSAELPCSVALTEAERDILFPNERLNGRTRDLSESGVGLVADSIYLGYTCVVDEGRALAVKLELPDRTVEMEATASGTLAEIVHDTGDEVAVGVPIAWLEDGA